MRSKRPPSLSSNFFLSFKARKLHGDILSHYLNIIINKLYTKMNHKDSIEVSLDPNLKICFLESKLKENKAKIYSSSHRQIQKNILSCREKFLIPKI